MKLLSQNNRGLNDPVAVDNLRHYLSRNSVDFLFVQEHKLQGSEVASLGRQVWKRAKYLFTEAASNYSPNGTSAGKGGVAAFISPKWASLVSQSCSLFGGRILWFILSRIPEGDLGFINIYAPTEPQPRKVLWETLAHELPITCRWILLGDFNMVERHSDKFSQSSRSLSAPERLLFNGLKDTLQVEECSRTNPSLSYSWDNGRSGSARVMARLDRVYIFPESPSSYRKILEYSIKSDHTRSDHAPVSFIFELSKTDARPSRWIMSSRYLDVAAPEIRRIWTDAPTTLPFFSKLKRVSRFYRKFCIS